MDASFAQPLADPHLFTPKTRKRLFILGITLLVALLFGLWLRTQPAIVRLKNGELSGTENTTAETTVGEMSRESVVQPVTGMAETTAVKRKPRRLLRKRHHHHNH